MSATSPLAPVDLVNLVHSEDRSHPRTARSSVFAPVGSAADASARYGVDTLA
jgi:hypothetical protein